MIDGLKLNMRGDELIAKLNDRIREYQLLESEHNDGRVRCRGKIDALTLIRDHIIVDEVYRLGEYDLRFADLLRDDDWLECDGFSENARARQGDLLERAMEPDA